AKERIHIIKWSDDVPSLAVVPLQLNDGVGFNRRSWHALAIHHVEETKVDVGFPCYNPRSAVLSEPNPSNGAFHGTFPSGLGDFCVDANDARDQPDSIAERRSRDS